MRTLLFTLLLMVSGLAAGDTRALLQLVDYVGVDYPEAVQNGEIINPGEYAEMQEFSQRIRDEILALPEGADRAALLAGSVELAHAIENRAAPDKVADITRSLREKLMSGLDMALVPRTAPDLQGAAALYQQQCAGCHGASGAGDGPVVTAAMEPAPTDFTDPQRARERSLFGLFNTITLGVEGTAMPAFESLSDTQRWSLAFYVGGLFQKADEQAASVWQTEPLTLDQAVTLAPAELARAQPEGLAKAVYARHHPAELFASRSEAVAFAAAGMNESLQRYRDGDISGAREVAVTAYLEGFELAEAPLANVAPGLVRDVEAAMISYRNLVSEQAPLAEVEAAHQRIAGLLDEAQRALDGEGLSPSVAFTSALAILLREGLEAILVVAAMAAFLVKTGRREGLPWLHAGWSLALLAGIGTWVLSSWVISISGAARELTEGVTALAAAAILFYVGFWMHSRARAEQWQAYIRDQLHGALARSTLWTLALVSFLAVYREVFETVLFYQALAAQVSAGAESAIFAGVGVAVLCLALVTVAIQRFGMRLPLSQFFAVTAWFLIALAVIFTGKGVAALQEAGRLPMDPVAFPRIDLLGIYPNVEGLSLQALVLLLAVGVMVWQKRRAESAT